MAYSNFPTAQLNSLRLLKYKHGERYGVKHVPENTIKELLAQFAQRTTIHGINHLFSKAVSKYERCVWLFTLIGALCGSLYVGRILSQRFSEARIQTVVDSTRYPVYKLEFPVVSICNLNRLNWERLEEAKRRYLPAFSSIRTVQLFERLIATYDDITFANFDDFAWLQNEPIDLINEVNFSSVYEFMTWRCEELLTKCKWRDFDVDCCEIFSLRRSKNGLCWAFNTLETEEGLNKERTDPFWPWHTGSAGPKSGLNVRILINAEKHFPNRTNDKGASVMLAEPRVWHRDPFVVSENTLTKIEMEPIIYYYDNETRSSLTYDQRECIFEGEIFEGGYRTLQGFVYMIENCVAECQQEYLVRYCNCTVDLLFPPAQYRSCLPKDMLCLAKHNDKIRFLHAPEEQQFVAKYYEGIECKCLRNCHSLNYDADMRPSYLPPAVRNNVSYIDLDVHYRFDSIIVYRTSLVFGWVDLLVAFGGIAGLFLGCSLISTVELAYFVLVELPLYLFRHIKQRLQRRRLKPAYNSEKIMKNHIIQVKAKNDYKIANEFLWPYSITHNNAKLSHMMLKN